MDRDIDVGKNESDREEWKEAFTEELFKQGMETLCAFLNTFGGKIVFGVDRKGQRVGLSGDLDAIQQRIFSETRNHLKPTASPFFHVHEKERLIEIAVKPDPSRIYQYRNVTYKRTGTSTHALTYEETKELEGQRKDGVREVAPQTFVRQKMGEILICPKGHYRQITGMSINMSVGGRIQHPSCPKCGETLIPE